MEGLHKVSFASINHDATKTLVYILGLASSSQGTAFGNLYMPLCVDKNFSLYSTFIAATIFLNL
jgi:hypothetical protein